MSTTMQQPRLVSVEEYRAVQALSNSGMKDLAVSPLHYWYRWVNPDRPAERETPAMWFGTGLHCRVLEGKSEFERRFACDIDESDHPDALFLMQDLRDWLISKGVTPKGTTKKDTVKDGVVKKGLIQQVLDVDPHQKIWEVMLDEFNVAHAGRTVFSKADWTRIQAVADALLDCKKVRDILKDGQPEVAIVGTEETTGVPLKGRLDWLAPECIFDFKVFTRQNETKSLDRTIGDLIYYEGYSRQGYIYSKLDQQAKKAKRPTKFVLAFIESEPPHAVRLKLLRPSADSMALWQKAEIETRHYCRMWQTYMEHFGINPWREDPDIEPLVDLDIPQLGFTSGGL